MKSSKSKILCLLAITVCICLLVSKALSLIIPIFAAQYGLEILNRSLILSWRLVAILNTFVFSLCAWNMRESKRLLFPLCLYIITQAFTAIFPGTSAVSGLLASSFLLDFYAAFCRHPESGFRISAFVASIGCGVSIFANVIRIFLSLELLKDYVIVLSNVIGILELLALIFFIVFWIAFAVVMKNIANNT